MTVKYMTVPEAASFLGVSDVTIKRYIRENLLQSELQNNQPMVLEEAVQRYKSITDKLSKH